MKVRFIFLALIFFTFFIPPIVSAKDIWINVRSKNFFLIGNANEKEIRQVATKLEQFRETFRLLLPNMKLSSSVQTNVVVFKNASAYRPFKPKRADGKPDDGIAGYFQSNQDLNYITLSTEGEKADNFETIFHEYVHFLLDNSFGKSEIPPWFNEGLAEYYSTFQIENDQKVFLGKIKNDHLYFLGQNKLIPLKQFFEVDNYSLHQNGNHSRSVFYAQAWALIHYLMQANNGGNRDELRKFLGLIFDKIEPEKAFKQAFQIDYATMEKTLSKYAGQSSFIMNVYTFKQKLIFDTEMTTVPLSESEANAYLGDLLYHTREYTDAETYLNKALALDPNSALANTSLGLVKTKQRKFDEANILLEKALASDPKNYFVYYNYAEILSREDRDEFGFVRHFPDEKVKKIRSALLKAVELKPDFAESYRLLGFISVVNEENLDEAIGYLKKGLVLEPGNEYFSILIAQIYLRQEKFAEAKTIAEKLLKNATEDDTRSNARSLLNSIKQFEEIKALNEKNQREYGERSSSRIIIQSDSDKPLTEAELTALNQDAEVNSLNRMIGHAKDGETQIVGNLQKIACTNGQITYDVKTKTESFTLSSKDFSELKLVTYITDRTEVGCGADLKSFVAVLTYVPDKEAKAKIKGILTSATFVPSYFRLKTDEELAEAEKKLISPSDNVAFETADSAEARKKAIFKFITDSLRKPQEGESREIGIVEKIECSEKLVYFTIKTATRTMKLKTNSLKDVRLASFTEELKGMQFGCRANIPPVSTIVTFRPNNDPKAKDNGEILSLEFVPKSFTLN